MVMHYCLDIIRYNEDGHKGRSSTKSKKNNVM